MTKKEPTRDAHLLAYLDGELDAETAAHIEASPELQARARELAAFTQQVRGRLFRHDCPDGLELTLLAAGRLPAAQQRALERHQKTCPHCQAELVTIRDYLSATQRDLEPGLVDRLRVLVARLLPSPQSGPSPIPAWSVRGRETGPLWYEAEEYQMSLAVQDDPDRPGYHLILGLLIGDTGFENWQATLHQDDLLLDTVTVDTLGNFIFSGLEPGTYQVILSGADVAVHIQGVEVS